MKNLNTLSPVPLGRVQIENGFWGERLRVNREVTLPIEYRQCKETGRIDAFRLNWKPGQSNPPHVFWDSDVAKWIEAASYSLATHPDAGLERQLDSVIKLIAEAQQDDGYLNVHFTVVEPEKRWSNLRDLVSQEFDFPGTRDPALLRVHLQLELAGDVAGDRCQDTFACFLTAHEDDNIIRVPNEAMSAPFEFLVELVEDDVTEQRRKRAALRRPFFGRLNEVVELNAAFQKRPDQLQHPPVLDALF